MCEMDDKIFVCRDVVAFLGHAVGRSSSILQLNIASDNYARGGVIANCTSSALSTGERITVAGLCVQLLFFSLARTLLFFTAAVNVKTLDHDCLASSAIKCFKRYGRIYVEPSISDRRQ